MNDGLPLQELLNSSTVKGDPLSVYRMLEAFWAMMSLSLWTRDWVDFDEM